MVFSFSSQKGGSGKTVSTLTICAALRRSGLKTMLIDCDQQGNLTQSLIAGETTRKGTYDILQRRASIEQAAVESPLGPLVAADARIATMDNKTAVGAFRSAVEAGRAHYDAILIDTPPALGIVTIAALAASDFVVIPQRPDAFGLIALRQIAAVITSLQTSNPSLTAGLIITQANTRSISNQAGIKALCGAAESYGYKVFLPPVRASVAVQEAHWQRGMTVLDTRSGAAQDYAEIADQIRRIIQKGE